MVEIKKKIVVISVQNEAMMMEANVLLVNDYVFI